MATTIQNIELPKKPRARDSSNGWQVIGPDLNTDSNPTSVVNESNDVSGSISWSQNDIALESSEYSDGSYSIKFTSTENGNRTYVDLSAAPYSLTVGKKYRISIDSKHAGSGDDYILQFNKTDGLNTGPNQTAIATIGSGSTTFVTYTQDIVFDADTYKYFGIKEEGDNNNASGYIDNFTIYELENFSNNNHGKIYSGRALEFDGVTDYLATGMTFSETNHTIAVWARQSGDVSVEGVLVGVRDSISNGIKLAFKTDEKIAYKLNDTELTSTTSVPNKWVRVVATYDGSTQKIYINGVLDASASVSKTISITSTVKVGRKSYGGANWFNGLMSDVQAWNTAWTADDVAYDYANPESLALNASGSALTEGNLKLWYPMQDGHRGQQSYILDGSNTGLGGEEVVNGNFGVDDNWTEGSGWDIDTVNNKASCDGTNVGTSDLTTSVGLAIQDKLVKFSFDISGYSGSATMIATIEGTGGNEFTGLNSDGSYTINVTSGDSAPKILFKAAAGFVGSIENISVKPINDKHHATTVFYGDDLWDGTQGDDANWSVFSSNTKAEDAGAVKITYVDNASGGYIMLRDANDLNADLVVGRTYIISFSTKVNQGSIAWRCLTSGGGVNATATAITSTSFETRTMTVVADHATDLYIHSNGMTTGDIVWIKDISVKEVGVASGWTDADQQLDIPQTALQSYNEMGMFLGVDDGTDSDVSCGSDASIDNVFDSGGTFSTWIYPIGIGAGDYGRIFDKNYIYFYLQSESGDTAQLAFTGITSGTPNTVARSTNRDINYGQWQHVVITYNADSPGTAPVMYINGVAIDVTCPAGAGTRLSDASDSLHLGNSANGTRTFNGCITEASFWEEILTAAEVLELYNEGKALDATTHSQADELKAYWRNNGLSTWTDLSTNTNNGTVNNITETILIPQGVDGSRDAQGFIMNKPRNTSSFNKPDDGDVSHVQKSTSPITGSNAMTLSAWIKPERIGGDYQGFVAMGDRDANECFWLGIHSNGNYAGGIYGTNIDTGDAVVVGDWVYLTITYAGGSGGALTLYRNDAVDGATTCTAAIPTDDTAYVRIGGIGLTEENPNYPVLSGETDGVLIYNKALSLAEVQRNYKATKGSHRN